MKHPAPPLLPHHSPAAGLTQEVQMALKATTPLRKESNAFALFSLSYHTLKWNDHVCTAVICFLPEDADNSCPVSLNARCRLSLIVCLMSPVG